MERLREQAMEAARAEAQEIIEDARRTSDEVFRELKEMQRNQSRGADWQETNEQRAGLRHKLNQAEGALGAKREEAPPPMIRPAAAGDTVELLKMGTQATVLSVNKDGLLQLQAGIMRVTARQEEVRVVEGETASQKEAKRHIRRTEHKLRSLGASPEVDLRGMTTDEAEGVVARFLDQAMLGGLHSVTIIHGKGTGAVRKTVHQFLKKSRYVQSFRLGRYGEGEDGVTVVELK
jgi:DNA mismatch repair protein MutS2